MTLDRTSDVIRACVVVGAIETPFETVGRGPAVVVLTECTAQRARLFAEMPRSVQLVVPDLAPNSAARSAAIADFGGWFGSFLDALGIATASLLTDTTWHDAAAAFARLEPERVPSVARLRWGPTRPY